MYLLREVQVLKLPVVDTIAVVETLATCILPGAVEVYAGQEYTLLERQGTGNQILN